MAHLRFQVAQYGNAWMVRDHIVNTFYLNAPSFFENPLGSSLTPDEQGLCDDAAVLWGSYKPYPADIDKVTVKVYGMEDAEPREIRAQSTVTIPSHTSEASGPREVALCLSFYSRINRPRSRGRMFLGPFPANQMAARPTDTLRTYGLTLAQGIADLGGVEVDWNIHSPTDNDYKKVSDCWVDDEWDTVRSRGQRATTRSTLTVDE